MNSSETQTGELKRHLAGQLEKNRVSDRGMPFLMYHEIDMPGRPLCRDFSGHTAYAVPQAELRTHLQHLKDRGVRGISVGEALSGDYDSASSIAITFDDGANSDLLAAAPAFEEHGFNATFYVVVGWLGREGYLSHNQVRELHARGFEIGCHTMSHRFIPRLRDSELEYEMVHSKKVLEQILGARVDHFSCPGGFWSRRAANLAKESGYLSVTTSQPGFNKIGVTDPYCLSRMVVRRGMDVSDFDLLFQGKGLLARRAKEAFLSVPKYILGPDAYVKLYGVFIP
ncbi:MAG: polysaccharide deacetylase family protein [Acidobacteriaceae bacterium]|nr:polysaccharide deacetylase family protein [Acidobacteriaceae bacterium]